MKLPGDFSRFTNYELGNVFFKPDKGDDVNSANKPEDNQNPSSESLQDNSSLELSANNFKAAQALKQINIQQLFVPDDVEKDLKVLGVDQESIESFLQKLSGLGQKPAQQVLAKVEDALASALSPERLNTPVVKDGLWDSVDQAIKNFDFDLHEFFQSRDLRLDLLPYLNVLQNGLDESQSLAVFENMTQYGKDADFDNGNFKDEIGLYFYLTLFTKLYDPQAKSQAKIVQIAAARLAFYILQIEQNDFEAKLYRLAAQSSNKKLLDFIQKNFVSADQKENLIKLLNKLSDELSESSMEIFFENQIDKDYDDRLDLDDVKESVAMFAKQYSFYNKLLVIIDPQTDAQRKRVWSNGLDEISKALASKQNLIVEVKYPLMDQKHQLLADFFEGEKSPIIVAEDENTELSKYLKTQIKLLQAAKDAGAQRFVFDFKPFITRTGILEQLVDSKEGQGYFSVNALSVSNKKYSEIISLIKDFFKDNQYTSFQRYLKANDYLQKNEGRIFRALGSFMVYLDSLKESVGNFKIEILDKEDRSIARTNADFFKNDVKSAYLLGAELINQYNFADNSSVKANSVHVAHLDFDSPSKTFLEDIDSAKDKIVNMRAFMPVAHRAFNEEGNASDADGNVTTEIDEDFYQQLLSRDQIRVNDYYTQNIMVPTLPNFFITTIDKDDDNGDDDSKLENPLGSLSIDNDETVLSSSDLQKIS